MRLVVGTTIEGTSGNDVIDCPEGVRDDTTVNGLGGDDRITVTGRRGMEGKAFGESGTDGRAPATRE
ncbi:hypothetical protein [Streptomyces sp. A1136]|uniref:hypothetical protein n=1 Tax=Streptomyces sp. A1136 TaxID=2563102 RepID=UPI00109EC23C|nr:hypothetical protein [Streptomyces sp. A1136]THA48345.1 hypothetical protein E6R62_29240 [Streptomyces sp. A1136]